MELNKKGMLTAFPGKSQKQKNSIIVISLREEITFI
jgi:hypothetical protein